MLTGKDKLTSIEAEFGTVGYPISLHQLQKRAK